MNKPGADEARRSAARIRSFVRRDSRITEAQKHALATHWPNFALPPATNRRDVDAAFGRNAPVTLEIGSGDGGCVIDLATRNPGENFVAVEVYRPGLGRLLNRTAERGLDNVRVSDMDICDLLAPLTEPVFDRVLVFFPDPWPKKRHHKRRLLKPSFFDLLGPRLQRHGRVFVATDDADYAASVVEQIETVPGWINLAGPGAFAPRAKFRPVTKFESRAAAAGSQVFDIVLARDPGRAGKGRQRQASASSAKDSTQ